MPRCAFHFTHLRGDLARANGVILLHAGGGNAHVPEARLEQSIDPDSGSEAALKLDVWTEHVGMMVVRY